MPANAPTDRSADDVLASLDEATARDAATLAALMTRITGHDPVVWNVATLGFDEYHYRYDSGREGDCHALGFHPRKGKLTIYLMDGTERHAEQLARLGPCTTSRACVYLKRLDGIDLGVLEEVLRSSYDYVKGRDGEMHRI